MKKNIDVYAPLGSSDINRLIVAIDKRKMISDIVQVYNANTYEIEVALKIFKSKSAGITSDLLQSKVNTTIDNFFDIGNIPLGKHFHLSRLIEWIHNNVSEIEHIEFIRDSENNTVTPSSTLDILSDRIIFTQIVEKTQEVNGKDIPARILEIIS